MKENFLNKTKTAAMKQKNTYIYICIIKIITTKTKMEGKPNEKNNTMHHQP